MFIKKNKKTIIVFSLCGFLSIIYLSYLRTHYTPDSFQYLSFGITQYLNNGPEEYRLFGYGTLFSIFRLLTQSSGISIRCILFFQWILWIISGILIYLSINKLCKNDNISLIGSALYLLCPSVINWNYAVLTENFKLFFICLNLYYLICFFENPKIGVGFIIGISGILGSLVHPANAIMIIINDFVFLLFFLIKRTKLYFISLLISGCISLLVLAYGFQFYYHYGVLSLSNTLLRQQLYIDIDREYEKNVDESISYDIQEKRKSGTDTWSIMVYVKDKLGNKNAAAFHRSCVKNNYKRFLIDTLELFSDQFNERFNARYTTYDKKDHLSSGIYDSLWTKQAIEWYGDDGTIINSGGYLSKIIFYGFNHILCIFSIGSVFIITIADVFYFLIKLVRRKEILWFDLIFCLHNIFVYYITFTGQCAEWGRTAVVVLPFTYILVACKIGEIENRVRLKRGM